MALSSFLVSQCDSQVSDFFNNPVIDFGGYVYASFPNGTIDKIFECFCNMNIVRCSFTFELIESLTTQYAFPYYFKITRYEQWQRQLYREHLTSSVICTVISHRVKDDIKCYRLPENHTICQRINCLHFAVRQRNEACPSDCTMVYWQADFVPKMRYINFGTRPRFQQNRVCPVAEADVESTKTSSPNNSFVDDYNFNDSDGRFGRNTTQLNISNSHIDRTMTFDLGLYRFFPILAGACLILVLMCVVNVILHKRVARENMSCLQFTLPGTHRTINEESEEIKYQTIDDIIVFSTQNSVCDEIDGSDGYTKIQD